MSDYEDTQKKLRCIKKISSFQYITALNAEKKR